MGMSGLLGSLVGAQGGAMIGRMLFGRTGGMVGGMLGSMLAGKRGGSMLGGLGGLFGGGDDKQQQQQTAAQISDDEATILIRAMVNSAKSDGRVDETEINAILGQIGEIEPGDEQFLRNELQAPLDLDAFIASVPADMSEKVYAVSLLSIDVDNLNEEHYLASLAQGLGISTEHVNELHDEVGVPRVF